MARPLKIKSSNDGLKEMTDAELDSLCYNLRLRYAELLNAGTITTGAIQSGSASGYTLIGSAANTIATTSTNNKARTSTASDDITPTYDGTTAPAPGDWPTQASTGTNTVTTYNYYQDRRVPSYPTASTFNSDSYFYWNTVDGKLQLAGASESHIYDEIVAQCITDMKTGDEVGTYRISTSAPTNGGAGTWTDKGTVFQDTTYSAGTTTYKLWLKTALTTPPTFVAHPVGWNSASSTLREIQSNNSTNNLVNNILLPVLRRRLDDGNLNYTIATSTSGTQRGTFVDKKQTGQSSSFSFTNPTYSTTATPNGSASDINTYYLNLIG
jgi:hypothetical protein